MKNGPMGAARDTAKVGDAFDARGDIDAVTLQVVALDHDITDMDADVQPQRLPLAGLRLDLDFHCTVYGLNRCVYRILDSAVLVVEAAEDRRDVTVPSRSTMRWRGVFFANDR
jgi:hypothetical protein